MVVVHVNLKILLLLQTIFLWKSLSAEVIRGESTKSGEDVLRQETKVESNIATPVNGRGIEYQDDTSNGDQLKPPEGKRKSISGKIQRRGFENSPRRGLQETNKKSTPPMKVEETKSVRELPPRKSEPTRSDRSSTGVRRYARKDEGSTGNSLINSGWGLLSSISNRLDLTGSQEQQRRRNPIEDIPILGGLVSLGGAIGLASRKGVDLVVDGTKKFGDLAIGSITKSNFKYAPAPSSTLGVSNALSGVSGLTRSELTAVATALAQSNGRGDFVRKLLEKATPESSYRIGLAAASLAGLSSNPAVGSATSVLTQLVGSRGPKI